MTTKSEGTTSSRSSRLGLTLVTALVVGNMIGSGIFLWPSSLASYGGISTVGCLFTTAGAVLLALVPARLDRAYPEAGGPYAYSRLAFGDFIGFLTAWGYWIAVWAGNAAIAVAFVSDSTDYWGRAARDFHRSTPCSARARTPRWSPSPPRRFRASPTAPIRPAWPDGGPSTASRSSPRTASPPLVRDEKGDEVVLAYSDLAHEEVMHEASIAMAADADLAWGTRASTPSRSCAARQAKPTSSSGTAITTNSPSSRPTC